MHNQTVLNVLKGMMLVGILLIILGVYLHNFSETMEEMGVTALIHVRIDFIGLVPQ